MQKAVRVDIDYYNSINSLNKNFFEKGWKVINVISSSKTGHALLILEKIERKEKLENLNNYEIQ